MTAAQPVDKVLRAVRDYLPQVAADADEMAALLKAALRKRAVQ